MTLDYKQQNQNTFLVFYVFLEILSRYNKLCLWEILESVDIIIFEVKNSFKNN